MGPRLTLTPVLDVPLVPPLVDVTVTELIFRPALVAVTLTENVQLALAARVAPERLMLVLPGLVVIVPPPHDPESTSGVETTRPEGRVSLKATPVSEVAPLGFEIVNVNAVAL